MSKTYIEELRERREADNREKSLKTLQPVLERIIKMYPNEDPFKKLRRLLQIHLDLEQLTMYQTGLKEIICGMEMAIL